MSKKKKKLQNTKVEEVKVEEVKAESIKDESVKEENAKEENTKIETPKLEGTVKPVKSRFWTKKRLLITDLIIILLLIVADQVVKYFATVMLENRGSIVLIEGVLQLTYLKNTGGIFGVLQNQTLFIMFIVNVFILIVIYLLTRLPDKPKFNIMHLVLSCLISGALGNMIDRIRFGYVVDFIYFIGIDFPIFNCADILISISTIVLLFLLFFYYKEKDLEFLTFKQKRYRELK